MNRWLNILLVLLIASFSLWCTGDLIRKSDQSAILAGANDLVHGRVQDWGQYYQYDKSYVLYWSCAGLIFVQRAVAENMSLIQFCNTGIAAFFWVALAGFVFRFRKKLSPVVLLCCLVSPAVLLNTLYVNSTVCSSAFFLLSMAFLFSDRGWSAALCFFLATGSRADIVLLLPLVLWLITPFPTLGKFFGGFGLFPSGRFFWSRPKALSDYLRSNGWKHGLAGLSEFPNHWKLIGAGLIALVAGPLLGGGAGVALDPFFNLKMVAGYAVFGFGAAGILFVWMGLRFAGWIMQSSSAGERLYVFAGLLAFLLPVLFFLPQLHAPRYFWRACEAILLVSISGCFAPVNIRGRRVAAAVLCALALGSLFVGIQMPELGRLRPVVSAPELFPSGDGHYPMGASLAFMNQLRNADHQPVDHNQLVWKALRSASFDESEHDALMVLSTPMSGHFMLEASLRSRKIYRCGLDGIPDGRPFYADSRSLMRINPKGAGPAGCGVLGFRSKQVSDGFDGVEILQFRQGDLRWAHRTELLNRLHSGNEYRIVPAGTPVKKGRRVVSFSGRLFTDAQKDEKSGLYYMSGMADTGEDMQMAVAVLPSWMSMQSFSGQ